MGQLAAHCFAQGSDNSLYALAFGFDLAVTSNDNGLAILLKSNTSPSNPNALTWSVVSTIRNTELFSFDTVYATKCIVDPNGAFIAWNYSAYRTGAGASASPRPGGFRYDPSLATASTTTTGKGGWVNIDTPLSYPWTSTSATSGLFYLKDSVGKYNIYHAFIPGSIGASFKFGALNTASTPNMMESSTTSWSVSSTITGYVDDMQTTSTKIFVWGVAGGSGSLFGTGDLPQTGPLTSSAPSLQLGNFTTPNSCSNPAVYGDKAYKYCTIQELHGVETKLFSWDGSKALAPIGMPQLPIKDLYTAATSGAFGDSSTSYLLVQSGALATQRGATGFGGYSLKALVLTGGSAGSVLDVPNNITVQDNIGFYSNSKDATSSAVSGGLKIIGAIAGLVFVCLVVIGVRSKRTVVVEKARERRFVLVPVEV